MKTMRTLVYLLSAVLAGLGAFVFFALRQGGWQGRELGEFTGILTLFSMGVEMLLWLCLMLIRSKKLPLSAQKPVVQAARLLHGFHPCFGALAVGALLLHFSLTADFSSAPDLRHLTGYVMGALILLSVLLGLGKRLSPKVMTKLHTAAAFLAAAALAVHLAA